MAGNHPEHFTSAFRAALDADDVEAFCIAGDQTSSDAGLLDDRISGEFSDEPSASQLERAERNTVTIDNSSGAVSDELRRRAEMPGSGYPFRYSGKSLKYLGSRSLAYEFCLAVSRVDGNDGSAHVRLRRHFERLSAVAAQCYLGRGAMSLRIGWPKDADDPRSHPIDFRGRADLLKRMAPADSGEWELAQTIGFESVVSNAKDHGMDFVAWKPFPDARLGRLTLLGQCACGRYDQEDNAKASELDFKLLKTIFKQLTWLDPVRVFSTPYHVNTHVRFVQLHALQNMVLDRARIAAVCEHNAAEHEIELIRPVLLELINSVFNGFKPKRTARPPKSGSRGRKR